MACDNSDDLKNNVGNLLERYELTQVSLARFCGVTVQTVNNWVKNKVVIHKKNRDKVCEFLRIDRKDLFYL